MEQCQLVEGRICQSETRKRGDIKKTHHRTGQLPNSAVTRAKWVSSQCKTIGTVEAVVWEVMGEGEGRGQSYSLGLLLTQVRGWGRMESSWVTQDMVIAQTIVVMVGMWPWMEGVIMVKEVELNNSTITLVCKEMTTMKHTMIGLHLIPNQQITAREYGKMVATCEP